MKWLKSLWNKAFGNNKINKTIEQDIARLQNELQQKLTKFMQAPPVLYYKILKLRSGEQVIAKIPYSAGLPIINQNTITLIEPKVFRMYYSPSINMNLQEEFILEDWVKLGSRQQEVIATDNIAAITDPLHNLIQMYEYTVIKGRLYKFYPHIAQHLFELSIIGKHPMSDNNNNTNEFGGFETE